MSRSVLLLLAIVVAGAVATAVAASVVGMDAGESLVLAGTAAAAAGAIGVAGVATLSLLRGAAVVVQIGVVAATGIATVAGGAWAVARSMFLDGHDLGVLGVVLLAGGTVAAVSTWLLARRIGHDAGELERIAQRLGRGDQPDVVGRPPSTRELATAADVLTRMGHELEDAHARERSLEASRRELVALVSHDLRSPLAAIRAMVEALEDGVVDDPETVSRYHRQARMEVDRLAALVDDLFELSRTQAGVLQLELQRVGLREVVSDALATAAPVARAKGVDLAGDVEGEPPELLLSPREIARALRNVLENAIRHTPADGTVFVEAGTDADGAFISVTDTCGGIAEADLERVFDVAFTGSAARTPGDAGAGLGLAIARGIVEAHQGEISVANTDGGCRFTISLPTGRPA